MTPRLPEQEQAGGGVGRDAASEPMWRRLALTHSFEWMSAVGLAVALVLLIVVISTQTSFFFTTGNFVNVGRAAVETGIAAAAMTLVLVCGELDLSVGAVIALGGIAAAEALGAGYSGGVAIAAGIGVGILAGAANAALIVGLGVNALIGTIGTQFAFRGLAYIWTNGNSLNAYGYSGFAYLGEGKVGAVYFSTILMVAVFVVLGLVLGQTRYGSHIYAIGGSRVAAKRVGIRTGRVRASVYVLSGAAAALAGLVVTSANGSASPQTGTGDELLDHQRGDHRWNGARRRARQPDRHLPGSDVPGGAAERHGSHRAAGVLADLHRRRRAADCDRDRRTVPPAAAARGMTLSGLAHGSGDIVLQGVGLRKKYGSVTAVDDVDIEIRAGEITAVVGDNGAGKSTLMKMLCGAIRPDAGEISIGGERVVLRTPLMARDRGIETVFQDLALAPNRDVVANLFLGRETVRGGVWKPFGVLDRGAMRKQARTQLAELAVNVPRLTGLPIAHLSGGQRQAVAVARAAFWARQAMLMDEPTAALGVRESGQVLKLARAIADRGLAVVLVSHILPHVMELADRIIVMRHGKNVAEITEDISSERLVRLIVGLDADDIVSPARRHEAPPG